MAFEEYLSDQRIEEIITKFIDNIIPKLCDAIAEIQKIVSEFIESNYISKVKYKPVKKITPTKTHDAKKVIYRARSNC